MVLLCKGLSQERLDSALYRVIEEALDSPFNSVTSSDSAPAQKATGNKRADQMVTFILTIHSDSYVNEVEMFVKQIDGVKRVKGYNNSIKLEVTGMVDPLKVQELVERETKKKVELIFPSAQLKGDRDKSQVSEKKLKNRKKMIQRNDIANEKPEESIYVLKIKLCCDSCNQKLKKILKNKGLETVRLDVEKDLVTVKGTVDRTEVRSYIKDELKKDVVIISPAEVVFPTKKDDGTAYKKKKDAGITSKIDRNDESTNKKDDGTAYKKKKDAGITSKIDRNDESTNKKDKGNNVTLHKKYGGAVTVDKNFKVTSVVQEKNEGKAAVDEKTKGIAAVDVKDKGITTIDEKLMGSATIDDKYKDRGEEKHTDCVLNDEKENGGGGNKKYKAFGGGGGCKKDGDGGAIRKANTKIYPIYDVRKGNGKMYSDYDNYYPLKYHNGFDHLFSDENPNSCCIM